MMESSNLPPAKKRAVRLTFSYDGDNVQLVSQQPVEMTLPPSDPVEGFEGNKGFWAELKDEQNKTLYRRMMHNPARYDVEVFSDDPELSVSRQPVDRPKGVFVILVPDTEDGREVTLSKSSGPGPAPGKQALASGPSTEFARFRLKK